MKTKGWILLGVVAFLMAPLHAKGKSEKVDVMSFNIRLNTPTDGDNSWPNRKANVAQMLRYYAPDIIGMQEVLHNQLVDLRELLPQYSSLGVGRADGKQAGEYCPLFYSNDRYTLVKQGTFGLSETPEKIGVKGWDAACERIATWALLKEKKGGQQLLVINTHFDHVGVVARHESAKMLMAQTKNLAPGVPAVIMGDFNIEPDAEPIQFIIKGGFGDSRLLSPIVYGPSWTFHGFGAVPLKERTIIDYIFVSPTIQVNKYRIVNDAPDGGYLSDHAPVMIEMKVR